MAVDSETLATLSAVLRDLRGGAQRPIPSSVIATLAGLAGSGRKLHIDMAASAHIGAPLVTLLDTPKGSDLLSPLTQRQREVATLMIKGCANREIAKHLGISVATVKDHVHAILARLGLKSRVALIAAAHATPET